MLSSCRGSEKRLPVAVWCSELVAPFEHSTQNLNKYSRSLSKSILTPFQRGVENACFVEKGSELHVSVSDFCASGIVQVRIHHPTPLAHMRCQSWCWVGPFITDGWARAEVEGKRHAAARLVWDGHGGWCDLDGTSRAGTWAPSKQVQRCNLLLQVSTLLPAKISMYRQWIAPSNLIMA